MRYIVGNRGPLKVGDRDRQPGEPIPEAAEWPNLYTYVSGGYVIEVPDAASAESFDITALKADDAKAFVEASTDLDALRAIADAEAANSKHPGGRVSVNQAIETRIAELEELARASDITAMTADEAKAKIADIEDVSELQALSEAEVQNPKHKGGRKGVLEAIETRIAELEEGEDEDPEGDEE
jgi:hypothetical protein